MVRAALVIGVSVWCTASAALACGGYLREELRRSQQLEAIADARRLLDAGKPRAALDLLRVHLQVHDFSDRKVENDAQLLAAVALARTGHARLAVRTLRQHDADRVEDPWYRARLAEALHGAGEAEGALAILDDLERRDLMPDAEAWATLARLRQGHGDGVARARALAQCRKQAQRHAVCRPHLRTAAEG